MTHAELKGISFVFYYNKNTDKIHCVDMSDKTITDGHGNPWFEGAYGNCLIFLQHQKCTDKLYLVSKNRIKDIYDAGFYYANNERRIEILEKFAKRTVERN